MLYNSLSAFQMSLEKAQPKADTKGEQFVRGMGKMGMVWFGAGSGGAEQQPPPAFSSSVMTSNANKDLEILITSVDTNFPKDIIYRNVYFTSLVYCRKHLFTFCYVPTLNIDIHWHNTITIST